METTPLAGLALNEDNRDDLRETARWARFLAIVGFIFCGLFIISGIFLGQMMANMSTMSSRFQDMEMGDRAPAAGGMSVMFTIIYVLIALLYFFPCLYLFRFSSAMIQAMDTDEQPRLDHSLRNLKSFFKFIGILTIIALCFYVIGMLGFIIGMSSMHMR